MKTLFGFFSRKSFLSFYIIILSLSRGLIKRKTKEKQEKGKFSSTLCKLIPVQEESSMDISLKKLADIAFLVHVSGKAFHKKSRGRLTTGKDKPFWKSQVGLTQYPQLNNENTWFHTAAMKMYPDIGHQCFLLSGMFSYLISYLLPSLPSPIPLLFLPGKKDS